MSDQPAALADPPSSSEPIPLSPGVWCAPQRDALVDGVIRVAWLALTHRHTRRLRQSGGKGNQADAPFEAMKRAIAEKRRESRKCDVGRAFVM
jgi:hypothetical protein